MKPQTISPITIWPRESRNSPRNSIGVHTHTATGTIRATFHVTQRIFFIWGTMLFPRFVVLAFFFFSSLLASIFSRFIWSFIFFSFQLAAFSGFRAARKLANESKYAEIRFLFVRM